MISMVGAIATVSLIFIAGPICSVRATETSTTVSMIRDISGTQEKLGDAQIAAIYKWQLCPFKTEIERAAFFGLSLAMPSFKNGQPFVPDDPYLRYIDIENLVITLLWQAELSARQCDWYTTKRLLLLALMTTQITTRPEFTPPRQVVDGTTILQMRDAQPDEWLMTVLVPEAAVPEILDSVGRLIAMNPPDRACLEKVKRLAQDQRRVQKQSARNRLTHLENGSPQRFLDSVKSEKQLAYASLNQMRTILHSCTLTKTKSEN